MAYKCQFALTCISISSNRTVPLCPKPVRHGSREPCRKPRSPSQELHAKLMNAAPMNALLGCSSVSLKTQCLLVSLIAASPDIVDIPMSDKRLECLLTAPPATGGRTALLPWYVRLWSSPAVAICHR